MTWKALSIGDVAQDIRIFIKEFPPLNREAKVLKLIKSFGGAAAFFSVTSAVLGFRSTILTKVGGDEIGYRILKVLKENGVNVTSVEVVPNESSEQFVTVYDRKLNRCIYYYRGSLDLSSDDIIEEIIEVHDIICICPTSLEATQKALKYSNKQGKIVVFNPSANFVDLPIPKFRLIAKKVDFLIVNETEAREYARKERLVECIEVLKNYGTSNIIITLGKGGCLVSVNEEQVRVPAYRVKAVDTTGSGDSFIAGFLYKYLNSNEVFESARFANAVGGCLSMRYDPIRNPPTFKEVDELYRKGKTYDLSSHF